MNLTLNKPFSASSAVDARDTHALKNALNRLGYYRPPASIGITPIPDREIFDALRRFQQDRGLRADSVMRPNDETHNALNDLLRRQDRNGKYIWRTVGDSRVRASHAALEGDERSWAQSPQPGEEENCRCWAEAVPFEKFGPPDCREQEEKFEHAKQRFREIDDKKRKAEKEIQDLIEENNNLLRELQILLGGNIVPWVISLPLPHLHVLLDILQEIFGNLIGLTLAEKAQEIGERFGKVREKIDYKADQLKIILHQFEEAENQVARAYQEQQQCKNQK